MKYTAKEIQDMTNNILEYMKQDTIEHFRKDQSKGQVIKYDVPMSSRIKKQLGYIAESVQQIKANGKYKNYTVGSPAQEPAND